MRALVAVLLVTLAGAASAQTVTEARYTDPTDRYDHKIFDAGHHNYGALEITLKTGKRKRDVEVRRFVLPHERVFEDIAPRLADLDGDGSPEVIVVESHLDLGARLAIYNPDGFVTATDWIGQSHRWLAPVGAIDIDRDGQVEVAFVDRPHLEKVLAIYRYTGGRLEYVVEIAPFTNHRIGDAKISGGTRTCKGVPAFIVGNGELSQVVAVTFAGHTPQAHSLGPARGPESFEHALECKKP